MSDLKVVLYSENRAPRSIALSTRMVYRTLILSVLSAALVVASLGLAAKFYILSRAKSTQTSLPVAEMSDEMGPTNSPQELAQSLRDQVDQLRSQLANANALKSAPKEIEKKNPALALFGPIVTDRTQDQDQVKISNFRVTKGDAKNPTILTFDLNNAHPGESTEKGYIVVLGRRQNELLAYPNVFNEKGPYLLDFEKGETFQVARFRLVNAQFDEPVNNFQILIFTRKGELLINTRHDMGS